MTVTDQLKIYFIAISSVDNTHRSAISIDIFGFKVQLLFLRP